MTWLAFGVGAFLGSVFTLFALSAAFVFSSEARHEKRVGKNVAAEQERGA